MPRGPKGQKRPADVVGNAVRVMEIETGQAEEEYDASDAGKDQAAAEFGRKGGRVPRRRFRHSAPMLRGRQRPSGAQEASKQKTSVKNASLHLDGARPQFQTDRLLARRRAR